LLQGSLSSPVSRGGSRRGSRSSRSSRGARTSRSSRSCSVPRNELEANSSSPNLSPSASPSPSSVVDLVKNASASPTEERVPASTRTLVSDEVVKAIKAADDEADVDVGDPDKGEDALAAQDAQDAQDSAPVVAAAEGQADDDDEEKAIGVSPDGRYATAALLEKGHISHGQ